MEENIQETEKSIIRVQRKEQFGASLRRFKVIVDNKIVGRIWAGDTVEVYVEPGNHEIYVKLDWSRSKKIKINTYPNETNILITGTINTFIILIFIFLFNLILVYWGNQIIAYLLLIMLIISSFIPSANINLKVKK